MNSYFHLPPTSRSTCKPASLSVSATRRLAGLENLDVPVGPVLFLRSQFNEHSKGSTYLNHRTCFKLSIYMRRGLPSRKKGEAESEGRERGLIRCVTTNKRNVWTRGAWRHSGGPRTEKVCALLSYEIHLLRCAESVDTKNRWAHRGLTLESRKPSLKTLSIRFLTVLANSRYLSSSSCSLRNQFFGK